MKRIPIWIDCDPGTDDAAALLTAHRLPELEIVGVSAVAGNVCLEKTLRNALALREFMGADFPVYAGAAQPLMRPAQDASEYHGPEGLGPVTLPQPVKAAEPEPMWDALYAAACRYAGELEVVTLAPLTSLATAFAKYPDLPGKLRRVSPELFTAREAGVFVETQSTLTLGKTVTDLYSDFKFPQKNALVLLDLDRAAFVRRVSALFGAEG